MAYWGLCGGVVSVAGGKAVGGEGVFPSRYALIGPHPRL